jgi:alkane 1-monooxygenase
MPLAAFAVVYALPVLAAVGLWKGGVWAWALPLFVYLLVPAAELGLRGSRANPSPDEEVRRRGNPAFDALLYLAVPVMVSLVVALAWRAPFLDAVDLAGSTLGVGTACGALSINVAHELGHRGSRVAQRAAKVLLVTSLYAHFFVEHNRGHHARVATPEDPASARRGESLYAFWLRSVAGSWSSAWELEAERLRKRGHGAFSLRNEVLRWALAEVGVVAAFGAAFGVVGMLAFVAAALIGVLLLETVNYVEHYGLARTRGADGRYERVRPAHSWTSDRPLSRVLLFELTRHADHHANPGRPYAVLRHFDEAPELPAGYSGMILLALLPPVFRRVMDRALAREQARLAA